jgi:hypothetical protein
VWNQDRVSTGGTNVALPTFAAASSASSASASASKCVGLPVLDHAEAAGLAFDRVEELMVVRVTGRERVAAHVSTVSTRSTMCSGNAGRVIQGRPAARPAR